MENEQSHIPQINMGHETSQPNTATESHPLFMDTGVDTVFYPTSINQDHTSSLVPTTLNQLYNTPENQTEIDRPVDHSMQHISQQDHMQHISQSDTIQHMVPSNNHEGLSLVLQNPIPITMPESEHLVLSSLQDQHVIVPTDQPQPIIPTSTTILPNIPLTIDHHEYSLINTELSTLNTPVIPPFSPMTSSTTERNDSNLEVEAPKLPNCTPDNAKMKRRNSITVMQRHNYNDLKDSNNHPINQLDNLVAIKKEILGFEPKGKQESQSYFTLVVGPGKHQVKEFNILPINVVKLKYEAKSSDYMVVKLICDKKMNKPESEIFITAVSAYHSQEDPNSIYFPNLKISQQMLRGRTKGYNFRLKFVLVVDGVEVEKVESEEFYLWSNVNQKGFPREERDSYVSHKVRSVKKRKRRLAF